MNLSNRSTQLRTLLTLALLAGAAGVFAASQETLVFAASKEAFASPDEAIKALQAAAEAKDPKALNALFGPEFRELSTGDEVQDANHARKFAAALAQGCTPVKENEDRITVEIGTNNWPMPIPLVRTNGQWHFDTAAGSEEIINRHIGKDELHAIGVCRAYVVAQRQYASANAVAGGGSKYAQRFKSAPGKKDGLYWPSATNEPASPFGPLVAEAHAEGYVHHRGEGPQPFHGYYFKILTRQGKAAPGGKMDYMSHGELTAGFALVAYPDRWDKSGIMTFIIGPDGKLFQRNLGEETARLAGSMKAFDPDSEWTPVPDEGVTGAESEK